MNDTTTPTQDSTAAAPAPAPKDTRNGITRPNAGTKTGRVWEIADELSKAAGAPCERKPVLTQCEHEGINVATGATQYGKWRKYHGLTTERAKPEAAASDASVETPAAPVAEAAAETTAEA